MPPQGRQCRLDYEKFPNNLQQWCEEAGGQHVLSYYMATCNGDSYSLQLAVSSEPGCVAAACRADDTATLLKEYATARVMARLEGGGNFNCTLSHFRNRQPTALLIVPPSEGPTDQQPIGLPSSIMPTTSPAISPSTNIPSNFPSGAPSISTSPTSTPSGAPSMTPSDPPSSSPTTVNGVSSACRSSHQYITPDIAF